VVYSGGIYTSTNSGATWTQTGAPGEYWYSVASSADGTHLVAVVYSGGIYTSTNSGATWTQTGAPGEYWYSVASSADGTHLVAVVYSGGICTSANSGATWTQTGAPVEDWWSVASSSDGTHLVAVVTGGGIYINSGSTAVASGAQGSTATLQYLGNGQWGAVSLPQSATNAPNTVVTRDASGNFSAGTITATAFVGNGSGLTNLSAAQLTSIGNTNSLYGGNFFIGSAGNSTTSGSLNTANGDFALYRNTSGSYNMADGYGALGSSTTGSDNTANGVEALYYNTTGSYDTANGEQALFHNTTGSYDTANGFYALIFNSTGNNNTANGANALYWNSTGNNNTADGVNALFSNTSGSNNIALGFQAGSIFTNGNNNIEIGNVGTTNDNNTIYIGTQGVQTNTSIAGIFGATAASGVAVYVNSSGKLGTLTSSARFKQDIHSMNDASEVLLSLHPVTFRYKAEIDPQAIPQFGLVAEEVEKIDPDLVARDDKGKIYTVRYEAVNAMLLNEFLKQHHQVAEQTTEIETLKQSVAELKQLVQTLAEKK
jgi:hypothetical protein